MTRQSGDITAAERCSLPLSALAGRRATRLDKRRKAPRSQLRHLAGRACTQEDGPNRLVFFQPGDIPGGRIGNTTQIHVIGIICQLYRTRYVATGSARSSFEPCFAGEFCQGLDCGQHGLRNPFGEQLVMGDIGVLGNVVQNSGDTLILIGHAEHYTEGMENLRLPCLVNLSGMGSCGNLNGALQCRHVNSSSLSLGSKWKWATFQLA